MIRRNTFFIKHFKIVEVDIKARTKILLNRNEKDIEREIGETQSRFRVVKFCRSTPLLRVLGVQRIPAMRDHQSVNLLKRCLAGSSAASTFYWSPIHNRDTDVNWTQFLVLYLGTLESCFMTTGVILSDFYDTT